MNTSEEIEASENPRSISRVRKAVFAVIALLALGLVFLMIAKPKTRAPLAEVPLADGRILQIEAVTYGTNHVVGDKSLILDSFGSWLPYRVRKFLKPEVPQSSMKLDRPALVVWVNEIDPVTKANVDSQGVRVEFVNKQGDLFGQFNHHFFGSQKFSRVGHRFDAFPRDEKELTLRITPLTTNVTATVSFTNPHVTRPESWDGNPVPSHKTIGDYKIVLKKLVARTNGLPEKKWETPSRYWKPEWRLLVNGESAEGWRPPEWYAEDPTGNHGQFLGLHQDALRYHVSYYPEATNNTATEIIAKLPELEISATLTNTLWNLTNQIKGNELVAIGFFTSRENAFIEGQYRTNSPIAFRLVGGASSSGWVVNKRTSPGHVEEVHLHFSDLPVIYLRSTEFDPKQVAVRLRDENGVLWPTQLDQPHSTPYGVMPFLVDLPEGAKKLQPEIVLLKPLEAEFTVKTPPVPEK